MKSKYIQSLLAMLCLFSVDVAVAAGMNPCAMSNPCSAKNPCAAKSDRIDPALVKRPAGTLLAKGNHNELVKEGKVLWNDTKLSSNGMSCNTCHQNNAAFSASFAKPYPHKIGMVKERAGIKGAVRLDEMVQFCMLAPMAAKPFPWDSRELAALTAYAAEVQKSYKASRAAKKPQNPCGAMKNPCAMQGNPCAMKH